MRAYWRNDRQDEAELRPLGAKQGTTRYTHAPHECPKASTFAPKCSFRFLLWCKCDACDTGHDRRQALFPLIATFPTACDGCTVTQVIRPYNGAFECPFASVTSLTLQYIMSDVLQNCLHRTPDRRGSHFMRFSDMSWSCSWSCHLCLHKNVRAQRFHKHTQVREIILHKLALFV